MKARFLLWLLVACAGLSGPWVLAQGVEIRGKVVDRTGGPIADAVVRVASGTPEDGTETTTDASGIFTLRGVVAGRGSLTVMSPGFARLSRSISTAPGETLEVGSVTLEIDTARVGVQVYATSREIATEQVREEETQRLLGVIPNFLVTYRGDAVPLTAKQKFGLAGRFTIDPSAFAISAGIAGLEQAGNSFPGYGQGGRGYAKRFGAAYGDFAISSLLGSAVLPALLKQDPRYFVKGTGTVRARLLYAVANSVIRKGDSGHWQPDYSSVGGDLAAGAISNVYYPAADRNGATLLFRQAGIGIGASAVANLLQEFVLRRLTRRVPQPKVVAGP